MTEGQKALRLKLLGAIHKHEFCKQSKKMDAWSDYLSSLYGVESSSNLSIDELYNLLDILNKKTDKAITKGARVYPKDRASQAQIFTMESIWKSKARDESHEAMMRFVKRVTGVVALHLTILSKIDASRVIIAMKRI